MNKRKLNFEWGDRNYHTPFGERDAPYAPCVPIVSGTYRGARRLVIRGRSQSSITARAESKRGGWYRGVTALNGKDVIIGAWLRNRQQALSEAREAIAFVKAGLDA